MLTPLDESPWHQLPTTFDHVATSDPRFFDRLWFAASDRRGESALQFTLGVYQNMNVVDGGFVAIVGERQHNLRVSRELRPRYVHDCGPLSIETVEPLNRLRLIIAPNASALSGELEWSGIIPAHEERHHFKRTHGREVENYSRYDQIGECSGWLKVGDTSIDLNSWWACRDHSWGVREMVGIPEPRTGSLPGTPGGAAFGFLFFSTTTHAGHVQFHHRADGDRHLTAQIINTRRGRPWRGTISKSTQYLWTTNVPDVSGRRRSTCTPTTGRWSASRSRRRVPQSPCRGWATAAMTTASGWACGGVLRTSNPTSGMSPSTAEVGHSDGTVVRPVHRIQPVRLVQHDQNGVSHGTGSLTFIAELPLDEDGHLRLQGA